MEENNTPFKEGDIVCLKSGNNGKMWVDMVIDERVRVKMEGEKGIVTEDFHYQLLTFWEEKKEDEDKKK